MARRWRISPTQKIATRRKRVSFGAQPFHEARVLEDSMMADDYVYHWRKQGLDVRKFERVVRAGGTGTKIWVVVARKKVVDESSEK